MFLLGVLLLALAIAVTVAIVLDNTGPVEAQAFDVALEDISVGGLFVLGVGTGALGLLGLVMLLSGLGRRRAKRKALKQQVREVRGERESLAEENARLQAQLEEREAAESTRSGYGHEGHGDEGHDRGDHSEQGYGERGHGEHGDREYADDGHSGSGDRTDVGDRDDEGGRRRHGLGGG